MVVNICKLDIVAFKSFQNLIHGLLAQMKEMNDNSNLLSIVILLSMTKNSSEARFR